MRELILKKIHNTQRRFKQSRITFAKLKMLILKYKAEMATAASAGGGTNNNVD